VSEGGREGESGGEGGREQERWGRERELGTILRLRGVGVRCLERGEEGGRGALGGRLLQSLSPLFPPRRATWPNGEFGYSTRRHLLEPVRPEAV
jgi:hypothetical protein